MLHCVNRESSWPGNLCLLTKHKIHQNLVDLNEKKLKQECIAVGCVPSAAVAIGWGGGVSQHALSREVYSSMHWAGGGVCPCTYWDTHSPSVDRILDTRL